MSTSSVPRGPGLYEVTEPDGQRWITNLTRKVGGREAPAGRGLVNTATLLLGALDAGLFAISLMAQYQYIFAAKHQSWPAYIEAFALDAAMIVFSLLALGLARAGQRAPVERFLIIICALGSAGMNYAAADVSSPRSVAAYVMPPIALAIVTDRVIAVVRRHVLGMEAERSAWAALGRATLVVAAGAGKTALYGLRLVLAPRSTFGGARALVLLATPLPGADVLAKEHAELEAARAALGAVHSAVGEDLRALRDRDEMAAERADENLRAAREAARTEINGVRETVRTEVRTVREAARADADASVRAALGPVHAALRDGLLDLRERHNRSAGILADGLDAARSELRAEIDGVRETVRTEIGSVREALRPPAEQPPPVDRAAVVSDLADQIRDAVSGGDRWTPPYTALQASTGRSRSWCEKAVRDAREQVFSALDPDISIDPDDSPKETQ